MSEENRKRPLEDAGKKEKRLKRYDRKAKAERGLQEAMDKFEKSDTKIEELKNLSRESPGSVFSQATQITSNIANAAKALVRFFFAGETGLNSAIYFTDPIDEEQSLALGVLKGEDRPMVHLCNVVLGLHIDKDKWKKIIAGVKFRENPKLKFIIHSGRTHIIFGHEPVQTKSISNKNFVNFWPDMSVAGIVPMVAYFDPRE